MLAKGNINLKFDRESQEYHVIWEPIVIGVGKTRCEALEDLRVAAHFSVDTLINMKSKNIGIKKED